MINKIFNYSTINGHTYSRQPLAAGQKYIDQMTMKSGHHINECEVRGEKIPEILTLTERDNNFLIVNGYGVRVVGGPIGSKYTNVIAFADKVSLKEIPNTNGESWQVVDRDGKPLSHFIDPSDKPISNTAANVQLSDGYTIQLFAQDKITPISINFGWTINTLTGVVHFAPEFKPGCEDWVNKGFGSPVLDGFVYIGKYTTDNINKVSDDIKITQENLEDVINNLIAIQPFKFSTDQMEKIGEAYPKIFSPLPGKKYEHYQRVTFVVPGYCFEVTALDVDETILTEMRHLPNGDTQIFMDLPWNLEYDMPILRWEFEGPNKIGFRYPVNGKYMFIATTFVKNNGRKIDVKPLIDFDNENFAGFNLDPYEYISAYDHGWRVPTPDMLVEGDKESSQADSSVNVNINVN